MKMNKMFAAAEMVISVLLAVWTTTVARAGTYVTSFPLTENPISEGGNWINGETVGLDWSDVKTVNGTAMGASTGSLVYNDPTAILTGTWGSAQTAEGTVWVTNRQTDSSYYGEVELRLRSSMSPHSCTGYEINFSMKNDAAAYSQIVRWNGPLGSFDYLGSVSGPQCILKSGDVVKATVAGGTITAYINGTQICQVTDYSYPSGNPGMGFYYAGSVGAISDFGFTSYMASDSANSSLFDAVAISASVYQSSDSVRKIVLTNRDYIAAVSATTGIPRSDLIIVMRESTGEIAVYRKSDHSNLFTIIGAPGSLYSASDATGGNSYAYGPVDIASLDTVFTGITFTHAVKRPGGAVVRQEITFEGGATGQVIQGACHTTGIKYNFWPMLASGKRDRSMAGNAKPFDKQPPFRNLHSLPAPPDAAGDMKGVAEIFDLQFPR